VDDKLSSSIAEPSRSAVLQLDHLLQSHRPGGESFYRGELARAMGGGEHHGQHASGCDLPCPRQQGRWLPVHYLTLLREVLERTSLPEHYIRFPEQGEHAQ